MFQIASSAQIITLYVFEVIFQNTLIILWFSSMIYIINLKAMDMFELYRCTEHLKYVQPTTLKVKVTYVKLLASSNIAEADLEGSQGAQVPLFWEKIRWLCRVSMKHFWICHCIEFKLRKKNVWQFKEFLKWIFLKTWIP